MLRTYFRISQGCAVLGYALAYAENAPRYAQNILKICSGYSGDMLCLDMFWDMLELLHDIVQIYFKYAYEICSDFCGICCFDGAR